MSRRDIDTTEERLTGGYSFLTISGGISFDREPGKMEYLIYSLTTWAIILTGPGPGRSWNFPQLYAPRADRDGVKKLIFGRPQCPPQSMKEEWRHRNGLLPSNFLID
jgi:hypothetical protein